MLSALQPYIFQSTLPREERQAASKTINSFLDISIHAPTRGATKRKGFYIFMDNSISIHAPTRGATCNSIRPLCIYEFQSTLPREERLHAIHFFHALQIFQSTLPREERLLAVTIGIKVFKFQSTLPREERQNPHY